MRVQKHSKESRSSVMKRFDSVTSKMRASISNAEAFRAKDGSILTDFLEDLYDNCTENIACASTAEEKDKAVDDAIAVASGKKKKKKKAAKADSKAKSVKKDKSERKAVADVHFDEAADVPVVLSRDEARAKKHAEEAAKPVETPVTSEVPAEPVKEELKAVEVPAEPVKEEPKKRAKKSVDKKKEDSAEEKKIDVVEPADSAESKIEAPVEPVKAAKKTKKATDKKEDVAEKKLDTEKELEVTDSKKEASFEVEAPADSMVEVATEEEVVDRPIDVVISFDTTGSMYSVLANVRRDIQTTVRRMFDKFSTSKLRIGIVAHGDYCDVNDPYCIRIMDFSSDPDKICKFVREIQSTYGGDVDECYELVLKTVRTDFNWSGGSQKILIMIGDASPHRVGYKCKEMSKPNDIDWENEAKLLKDSGIQVYGVHALHLYRKSSKGFYQKVSKITDGTYLTLDNFGDVLPMIEGTVYKNHSTKKFNEFVEKIRTSSDTGRTLWDVMRRLRGEDVDTEEAGGTSRRKVTGGDLVFKEIPGLHRVPAGRFQVIDVLEPNSIKEFVQSNGIKYKVGQAFYELTKTEDVQQYKEIILQDKKSGDMYYGDEARKHLGLLPQCTRHGAYAHERIRPAADDKYRVFVQSTSVNRKLVANTKLLYEVAEITD